jgi:hypothetical protein
MFSYLAVRDTKQVVQRAALFTRLPSSRLYSSRSLKFHFERYALSMKLSLLACVDLLVEAWTVLS